VIAKVCPRGRRAAGLLRYLYSTSPAQQEGRGRRNPHVDPRVVAGFDDPAVLEPSVGEGGRRDFRRLVSLLEQPLVAAGVGPDKRPVYHLVVAAKKDPDTGALVDEYLSDEAWGDVAGEYVHRIGLSPRDDDLGARWVAVRHADDHIHVVVTLARQDGRRVFPRNDFWRAGEASRAVEEKYGLSVTAASDRTAAKRPTYAETAKAERQGDREPVRDTLRRSVRTAAAGSSGLGEFLDRLRVDGVMVRERFSERTPGQVTGYSVALPGQSDPGGKPIYFGGGKLAADLTLPKLLRRWDLAVSPESAAGGSSDEPATAERSEPVTGSTSVPAEGAGIPAGLVGEDRHRLTAAERDRIWEQATAAAATATEQVSGTAAADPGGAADAAWAASDFLSAAARVVEGRRGGPLTAAAGEYDRAARELWGRVPQASAAGKGLRAASVLLSSARFVGRGESKQLLALLAQLAALSDAVTRLRESQDRAVQAAAARRAAEGVRLTSAQRTSVHPGSSATTAPRTRRPEVADVEDDRRRQGPPQGPPHGPRRGPRL
jgi:hypothetical protein